MLNWEFLSRYTHGMTSATFDTLQAARELQEAGIDRKHAEAIAHVVGLSGEDYATKGDLSALEVRLGAKIKALEAKIKALEAKIETFGAKIEALVAQVETKVEQGKNVILRSILTAGVAIIVTLIGGIFTIVATG